MFYVVIANSNDYWWKYDYWQKSDQNIYMFLFYNSNLSSYSLKYLEFYLNKLLNYQEWFLHKRNVLNIQQYHTVSYTCKLIY